MRFSEILLIAATSAALGGCSALSWFGFGDDDGDKPKVSDSQLCVSKAQIAANHSYYESWQACERLAAKGDHKAEYVLGLLYTDDKILGGFLDADTRFEKGIEHIKNAADNNVPAAQRSLGEYYEKQGNSDLARLYISKAAENGDSDALIGLATSYETEGSCQKATDYYEKEISVKKDAADGWLYLYLLAYTGCKDLKPNPNLACAYYHNVLNSSSKNTLLSLISYEKEKGTAAKKDSITRATSAVQDHYKKNMKTCAADGEAMKSRLMAR